MKLHISMTIYLPGVYTFNGYFSEEDLQMFWVYRYKGFSFTAARTVHTALVLAGIYCVNIPHSIYTARRQAAAEQKEQTV